MAIEEYNSQQEMDDDFEQLMEREQEKARLDDEICIAQQRVAEARDILSDAEEDLATLREALAECDQ